MLEGLKDFAYRRAYGLARRRGGRCGGCGAAIELPQVVPAEGWEAEFRCGACGWSGGLLELGGDGGKGVLLERPAGSRVVESVVDGGVSWLVPAKKGIGFLMVFGALWLGISLFVAGAFIFGEPTDADTGEAASGWWGLFFIPFLAIGLGVLYAGLRMRWTEVLVMVDEERVRVLKKFFGRVREQSLAISDVDGVWLSERYRSDDDPVYELFVAERDGDGLGFGCELADEEKRWLVGRMREFLPEAEDEAGPDGDEVAGGTREGLEVKGLRVEGVGNDGFRVVRKHLSGKWMILAGVLVVVVTGIFLADTVGDSEGGGDGWIEAIFGLLEVIPLLALGAVFLVGVGLFFGGFAMLGREDVFVFGGNDLRVEKRRGGSVRSRKVYARDEVSGARVKRSGSVNNSDRFKVDLKVGDGRVVLCGFVEKSVADDLMAWMEDWISGPQSAEPAEYGGAMRVGGDVGASVARARVSGGGSIYRKRERTIGKGTSRWVMLFPGVFVVVGLAVLVFGVRNMMLAQESESWPSVGGRVTSSTVTVNSDSDGTTYGAKVRYGYRVDGSDYEGDRVGFGSLSSSNRSRAQKVVARYPVGADVEVYYREGEPEESALETGVQGVTWFLPVFGLVFFGAGVVMMMAMVRGRGKGR